MSKKSDEAKAMNIDGALLNETVIECIKGIQVDEGEGGDYHLETIEAITEFILSQEETEPERIVINHRFMVRLNELKNLIRKMQSPHRPLSNVVIA